MSGGRLMRYDAACRALAAAKRVDEVKQIRDISIAMRVYARQANNHDLEADAIEIRMRATRRMDQIRQEQKETIGLAKGTRGSKIKGARVDDKPTLADAGINKALAHEGRKLGALSDQQFELTVAEARDAVTSAVGKVVRSPCPRRRRPRASSRSRLRSGNQCPRPSAANASIQRISRAT